MGSSGGASGGGGGAVSSVNGRAGAVTGLQEAIATGTYVDVPAGTPTVGQVALVTDDSPLTFGWGDAGSGEVTQDELDDGLALKADIADLAPLSDSIPLPPSGIGSAGISNEAMRADAFPPLSALVLPQPLVLEADAIDEAALDVRAVTGQTAPIQVWKDSAGNVQAGVGAGVVDLNEGIGFPQITGFPRLRAQTYSTFGLVKCTGVFQVEQNFFLVGAGATQGFYSNSQLSWLGGDLQIENYGSGAGAQFRVHQGLRADISVTVGAHWNAATAAEVEVGAKSAARPCIEERAFSGQTADIHRWADDAGAILSRINKAGFYMTRKVAAPADGDLAAGELAIWLDATNGAGKAMFKAKTADGTVVTAAVALA